MNRIGQEVLTTLTGNLPKAVLCVRDINKTGALDLTQTQKDAQDLQKEFLKQADARLKNPLTAAQDSYKTIEKVPAARDMCRCRCSIIPPPSSWNPWGDPWNPI